MAFADAFLWLVMAAPRGYAGVGAVESGDEPEPEPVVSTDADTEARRPAPARAAAAPSAGPPVQPDRTRVGPSGPERVRIPDARTWVVGVFADAGYVYDSNHPDNHVNRGEFTAPRSGEFTVPFAAVFMRHDPIESEPWQVEVALQAGPATAALVENEPQPGGDASRFAGPQVWQHLGRANVGGRIPKAGTEIAAGLFGTPISMWSFWTKDNWNYSTPWHLNAVPYVLMGARVLQPIGKRVVLHAWVVNGAQTYADLNKVPSYLAGVVVTPTTGLQIAQMAYFGPEDVDPDPSAWRLLSDTWVFYDAGRWGIAAAFDVMRERLTTYPDAPVAMYVAGAIAPRVRVLTALRNRLRWYLTARGEVFWDRDGRIYGVDQLIASGALTSDLRFWENLLVRVEYRYDQTSAENGYFYRHEAIHDDDEGLARKQHTVYFTLTGMFEHWFAIKRKPR